MKKWQVWLVSVFLVVIAVASIVWCVPMARCKLLQAAAESDVFTMDARARFLAMSVAAGGSPAMDQLLVAMLSDSEPSFSLVVLEYVRGKQLTCAHDAMQSWLKDDTVAWPNDIRKIRRCDLASYYFRTYVGEGRWDIPTKSLVRDLESRDLFRSQVQDYIAEHGLPKGD